MEHTFLASYVCLLIGNLVMECKQHEAEVRKILRNKTFVDMVQILEKYYNFLNLTASVSSRICYSETKLPSSSSFWFQFFKFSVVFFNRYSRKPCKWHTWKRQNESFNSWRIVICIRVPRRRRRMTIKRNKPIHIIHSAR